MSDGEITDAELMEALLSMPSRAANGVGRQVLRWKQVTRASSRQPDRQHRGIGHSQTENAHTPSS